jgi:hypothetical protein
MTPRPYRALLAHIALVLALLALLGGLHLLGFTP